MSGKWDWRRELTTEEAAFIAEADQAREAVRSAGEAYRRRYSLKRVKIVNRAIKRAEWRVNRAGAGVARN